MSSKGQNRLCGDEHMHWRYAILDSIMFMWQYKICIFFFFFFTFMSGKRNEKQVGTEGGGVIL